MLLKMLNIDLYSIMPQMLLTGLALSVLVLDFFVRRESKRILGVVSAVGLFVILPVACTNTNALPTFAGMVFSDGYAAFFNAVFIAAAILTTLISIGYIKKFNMERGEYYPIILFATLGMTVMAAANDLISLYVGLELMALSFYVLVAMRSDGRAAEGGLKYYVLGAFSSGILLYGISFVYGASGSTNFMAIARHLVAGDNQYLVIGIVLMVVGFAFKAAAFPFHLWAPDAYESAPTPVTAFLSIGSKAAAFAVFLRLFVVAFHAFHKEWADLLWMLSALTMVFGSVVAISQKNIIRMLAYSSIAHAGIIIIGMLVLSDAGIAGVLFYFLVYAFMNMGAFTVVTLLLREGRKGESITDYRGLASSRPLLALLFALFLLSLAGIPPTGGFAAKFFILASAINAKYYWLAAIGVMSTAISLFFYAKVIFYMYMREPDDAAAALPSPNLAYSIVLVVTAACTIFLGVFPNTFIEMALKAARPLLIAAGV